MPEPVEVVIARRRRSGKETVVSLLVLAGYIVALKVADDVTTGSWSHSPIRLRLLAVRDRVGEWRRDFRQTAEFRAAVRQTLDGLEEYDPEPSEPEPSEEV